MACRRSYRAFTRDSTLPTERSKLVDAAVRRVVADPSGESGVPIRLPCSLCCSCARATSKGLLDCLAAGSGSAAVEENEDEERGGERVGLSGAGAGAGAVAERGGG